MRRLFEVGDPVMLLFGPLTARIGVTPELSRMEERIFYISRIRTLHNHSLYELEGCVSKRGVPFTITQDWLVPYHEVSR